MFSGELKPAAHAAAGDTLIFECVDCYSNQIENDETLFEDIKGELNNPATGPVFIEGAEKGDILRVDILEIEADDRGVMTVRPGAGLYGDLLDEFKSRVIPIKNNRGFFKENIAVDLLPMIGVIGTAPNKEIRTTWPGEHGGNLDIRDLQAGTSLYLPVAVRGALLSMGDLHGIQGDGETVICGLEMNGRVRAKVTVLKNRSDIPTPFIVTPTTYVTTFAAPTLDEASRGAGHRMHRFLLEHTDLTAEECAMLLSLAGNLRISQVVNDLKGCLMDFPRNLAGEKMEL